MIHLDLNIEVVKDKIKTSSEKYQEGLKTHLNSLAVNILVNREQIRRLKSYFK